jgi:hypothetical protein
MQPAEKLARQASGARPALEGLQAVVALRRELDSLEERRVDEALRAGHSWSEVAAALEVTKQAAHKRHAGRSREGSRRRRGGAPARRLLVTGQARRVVEFARGEAAELGSPTVEPDHLLLGLLRDDHGAALRALERAGVSLASARERAEALGPERGGALATGARRRPRVSPDSRRALEDSLREAMRLGDSHLGVEHLLLALVRDGSSRASKVLAELGVPPREVEDRVYELVGQPG